MSQCVEKLPHECSKHGKAKDSNDGLQVFQDNQGNVNGYCFSCGTYEPLPYSGGNEGRVLSTPRVGKSAEQTKAELEEIASYPCVALPERKLKQEYLDHYGIKIGLSEYDGETPFFHYYPYYRKGELTGYKVRMIENKAMWSVGSTKGCSLFGWEQALGTGAKTLFITEGELDAVALYQALCEKQKGSKWESYKPAVVSLRSGAAAAARDIQEQMQEIRAHFKDVVLVFDQDEPGQAAIEAVSKILPTARSVSLPAKDANQAVIEGRSNALCNAVLFKAEVQKNTRIVAGTSLIEAARKKAEWGLSWPWKKLTEMTRGIRFGETYYLGAGVKMGKSEVVNALAAHLMIEHGLKIFLAKPEEANVKTFKLLCGKVAGKVFHDPKIEFDEKAYDEAAKKIADKVFMLDLYQHMDWNSLKQDIVSAVHSGCKAIFIDPITNLVNGQAASEQNTHLQEIAQELASMAKDLDVVIFIFCHLKAPVSGEPHERGGEVLSSQFAGSRAMMRSCNLMLGLEGNKRAEDEKGKPIPIELRNMRKLVILEDREFGVTGSVSLYWNEKNGLFTEAH